MKKTVLSLLLLLPFLVMGQANPYSVEEFLQLFPKVNPVGLHVYFAGSEENYYPESVQSDRPVGRFIGTPLETSRCKILADAKICDFDYYYEEILKNTFVDYGPMAYAVARFDLDNDHQALIIRHYGEYEVSQISLFVWGNNSQKFEGQVSLANSSGDAGEMWEHESWISIEKGVLVVKTHDIWYYGDIDVYFDELGAALESGDTTKLPINKMTEFHSKMMVNRWMGGHFLTDSILNPTREDGYPLIDSYSDEQLAWALQYSGKADTLGMDYAWIIDWPIETPARFPGGDKELGQWLKNNIQVPANASGEVWVLLKIGYEGEIAKVLPLKTSDTSLGLSVCLQLSKMPKWTPARTNAENLNSDYKRFKNARVESQHVLKIKFKKGKIQ